MNENKNMYVTVAFAGVALMVALLIGVVVMRRRNTRYPHHQVVYSLSSFHHLSPSLTSYLSPFYIIQHKHCPLFRNIYQLYFLSMNVK